MQTIIGTDLDIAADILSTGGLVAIPTETVYGLAANGLNEQAVRAIFDAKGRPTTNPLILHVASIDVIEQYVTGISPLARKIMDAFMPGPLTVLLPKTPVISSLVTAGSVLAAFRVPAHPLTNELLSRLLFPLTAPSANKFMSVSPTTASHVYDQLNGLIPYILDGGPCDRGLESTIVSFSDDQVTIHRPGAITLEQLRSVHPMVVVNKRWEGEHQKALAPGGMRKHYSPGVPMLLTDDVKQVVEANTNLRIVCITLRQEAGLPQNIINLALTTDGSLEEAGKMLYRTLREAAALEPELLVVERMPDIGLGRTINDRLERASAT